MFIKKGNILKLTTMSAFCHIRKVPSVLANPRSLVTLTTSHHRPVFSANSVIMYREASASRSSIITGAVSSSWISFHFSSVTELNITIVHAQTKICSRNGPGTDPRTNHDIIHALCVVVVLSPGLNFVKIPMIATQIAMMITQGRNKGAMKDAPRRLSKGVESVVRICDR